jgi:hypothetical protein
LCKNEAKATNINGTNKEGARCSNLLEQDGFKFLYYIFPPCWHDKDVCSKHPEVWNEEYMVLSALSVSLSEVRRIMDVLSAKYGKGNCVGAEAPISKIGPIYSRYCIWGGKPEDKLFIAAEVNFAGNREDLNVLHVFIDRSTPENRKIAAQGYSRVKSELENTTCKYATCINRIGLNK